MSSVPGLPVGADEELARGQVAGEADPTAVPRLRRRAMRGPTAPAAPDHPALTQRGDHVPTANRCLQDV